MRNLSANQPQIGLPIPWRRLNTWPPEHQPAALWPWLSHSGSLTEKLRATVGGAFHVKVLHEGVAQLNVEDAMLLRTLAGTAARLREVHLYGASPVVFARTLALAEAASWLQDLNTQPLGDRVFAEGDAQRGVIEIAQLDLTQALYRAAVQEISRPSKELWARRSVLTVRDSRLLIYECFLSVPEP